MKRYLAILGVLASCSDGAFYEKNVAIADRSWEYRDVPTFEVKVEDNKAKYDIYINVRHTNQYDFSNLFLLLHQQGKGIKDTAYRHEISLAELDGRWKGKTAGSLVEVQHLALTDFVFPDTGSYIFRIEQNMRKNPLKEINDVGLKVIKK